MSHSEVCPTCMGRGKVKSPSSVTSVDCMITCHGCGGKGWVEIGDLGHRIENTPTIDNWVDGNLRRAIEFPLHL